MILIKHDPVKDKMHLIIEEIILFRILLTREHLLKKNVSKRKKEPVFYRQVRKEVIMVSRDS